MSKNRNKYSTLLAFEKCKNKFFLTMIGFSVLAGLFVALPLGAYLFSKLYMAHILHSRIKQARRCNHVITQRKDKKSFIIPIEIPGKRVNGCFCTQSGLPYGKSIQKHAVWQLDDQKNVLVKFVPDQVFVQCTDGTQFVLNWTECGRTRRINNYYYCDNSHFGIHYGDYVPIYTSPVIREIV